MGPKYQIGSLVQFTKDRYQDEAGEYMPYDEKYTAGQTGYVVAVSDTKVSGAKTINDLSDTNLDEYMYTIKAGLGEIVKVPESDLVNPNASIAEKVEQRLKKAQEKKEFKDTEGRVRGSKKERMAYKMVKLSDLVDIEQDEETAIDLIKKDRVFPKINVPAERERGVASGAAYLKVKTREAFAKEPPNNKDKRKVFTGYADYLTKQFENIVTVSDFVKFANDGVIKTGLTEIIRTLQPELAEKIDEERNEKATRRIEVKKEINAIRQLREQKTEQYKTNPNENSPHLIYDEIVKLNALLHQLDLEEEALEKKYTETEIQIAKTISGREYITRDYHVNEVVINLFSEVFGKRFINFFGKNLSENIEEANNLTAISEEESRLLIESEGKWYKEQIEANKVKVETVKNLIGKEAFDQYFNKDNNGSMGFSGGEFAKFGRGYFYYKDIRGEEQYQIYKRRYLQALQNRIDEQTKKLTAIEEKYKPREEDWSWYFDKPNAGAEAGDEKKKGPEIKINTYPPLSFIRRIGGIKILDDDVNTESIIERFGFKTVQFGGTLKDTEAKEHVRHFLGSMADLADILNMNVVQLNQLGGLSIAFASRGGGKASAHYEPLYKIINITKTRGGGAIAHEYMHYIDNILPKFNRAEYMYKDNASDAKNNRYGQTTYSLANKEVEAAVDAIFQYIYKRRANLTGDLAEKLKTNNPAVIKKTIPAGIKTFSIPDSFYDSEKGYVKPVDIDEYWEHFIKRYSQYRLIENLKKRDLDVIGSIVKRFGFKQYEFTFTTNQSQYYAHSLNMSSDYWTRPWELFARAFETYIYDKLDRAGRSNNYLVSGAYFDYFVYPQGDEREVLFVLYDKLMATIKTEHQIGDFVPWSTDRTDEYIALEGDKDETVESGIITDAETGEVIDKIEGDAGFKGFKKGSKEEKKAIKYTKIDMRRKLQVLLKMLKPVEMEQGGQVGQNQDITSKLSEYLLTLKQ